MSAIARFDPGSFRDRAARVFHAEGEIYRALGDEAYADWQLLSASSFYQHATANGRLIGTAQAASAVRASLPGTWRAVLRHERVSFVSYPYEWPFGMLRDAAALTLDLLLEALAEGLTLKDATPYNVQWRGARPVFIDITSFERYEAGSPWAGYLQFCQLFLYPLLLQSYRGLPFQPWLRSRIDGIEPHDCFAALGRTSLMRAGVLSHVYLQAKAQDRYGRRPNGIRNELKAAGFSADLIRANARGMRRLVGRLRWEPPNSTWSAYATHNSYDEQDARRKAAFVRRAAEERKGAVVWDIGCNTGRFSRLVAEHARYVVALDSDHLAVERLYRALAAEGDERILPLIFDVTNPSPGLGWRHRERMALVDRGRPTLVLCLALLHHLVIGANIPLTEVLAWLAELGADLVIEFVSKQDPMVQQLLQNKKDLYDDYEAGVFERELRSAFDVVRREQLSSGTRALYLARPKRAPRT